MKRIKIVLMLVSFLILHSCARKEATWISTTHENRWQEQPVVYLTDSNTGTDYLEIQVDSPQQVIDGFGTCFNELAWDALQLVDEPTRNQILNDLFNPEEGLKFSYCRTPMGANDYSRGWYSYNEVDGDFEMKNFSIERDRETLIPFIKSALDINPSIRLWATPWSMPAWTKTNKHYANKSDTCNDLPKSLEVPLYTDQVIQEPRYLQALALYFDKYLSAYKAEGIDISMVMFQNEAFTFNQWPTGSWKPQSIADFNLNYLAPHLAKTHPEVELYAGTFNTFDPEVFKAILDAPESGKYIKGVGLQWEGREIVAELRKSYPGLKLMQTESECGNGRFGWADAEHTFNLMKRYFNGGVNAYMNWNMVLKDEGYSAWCWTQNALIRIMSDTKEVIYTPEYYVYKHISSFVPEGSVKLPVHKDASLEKGEKESNALAFKTPGGEVVIVVANDEDHPETVAFKVGPSFLKVDLPSKSFNTLVVPAS